jgi:capsular exopolysaccharide synthesis family protein
MTGTDEIHSKSKAAETPTSTPAGYDMSLMHVWDLIRRRKGFIAFGFVLGLALSCLYYFRATPMYQAEVEILVMRKDSNLPTQGTEGSGGFQRQVMYEDLLSTHLQLLQSPRIIKQAIKKNGLESLASIAEVLREEKDPAEHFAENLTITKGGRGRAKDAHVLHGTFLDASPEDCATILSALVDSYQNFWSETFQDTSGEALKLISQAKLELGNELKEEEKAYREFREKTPILSTDSDGRDVHQQRLFQIGASLSEVRIQYAEAKARLEVIQESLRSGSTDDHDDLDKLSLLSEKDARRLAQLLTVTGGGAYSGAFMSVQPLRDEKARAEYQRLLSLLIQEKTLLEDFGQDHPKVQTVREQIDLTRKFLEENAPPASAVDLLDLGIDDLLNAQIGLLKHDLSEFKKRETELETIAANEEQEARKLVTFVLQDEMMSKQLARKQELYNAVIERLREINLIKDYGGYITEVISPVEQPRRAVSPNLVLTLGMGCFLGLFFGMSLAYVMHLADRTFHNPDELRQAMALPIMGHIPALDGAAQNGSSNGKAGSRLAPTLVSYHRPRSQQAEAFRGLRTALYFNAHVGHHKVIQVTSANPRDGKSTVAANLAICMAQSGKNVLLVDCDLRNSKVHKLFAVDSSIGMSHIIADKAELPDAIQSVDIENLSILPCGAHPSNPSELLTSTRFDEVIKLLSEKYDLIIIDTPPMLVVSDPATIASRVDGVLLVVRITKDGRPEAIQARQLLQSMGAEILGIVVNGWQQDRNYGYGYYGRKYGYGYGYGDKAGEYYSDEEPVAEVTSSDASQ